MRSQGACATWGRSALLLATLVVAGGRVGRAQDAGAIAWGREFARVDTMPSGCGGGPEILEYRVRVARRESGPDRGTFSISATSVSSCHGTTIDYLSTRWGAFRVVPDTGGAADLNGGWSRATLPCLAERCWIVSVRNPYGFDSHPAVEASLRLPTGQLRAIARAVAAAAQGDSGRGGRRDSVRANPPPRYQQ